MKITQLVSRIEGSGVTRYTSELYNALISIGHEVEIVVLNCEYKNGNSNLTGQTLEKFVLKEMNDETASYINKSDLVIVNSFIGKKNEYRDAWIDFVQNKITTRKVIVINDHKTITFTCYYGDLLKRKDFWLSFDKICNFSYDSIIYTKIRSVIGEENAKQRYMHLLHPYAFNDALKSEWVSFQDKKRRVGYLGRHALFKDNTRLLRARDYFWAHDYELEMRGIRPTMNTITIPDFKYVLDENYKPIVVEGHVRGQGHKYILSPYTYWVDDVKSWRSSRGFDMKDSLIHQEREKNRIYIFGAYKHEDGLNAIKYNAFGANFYNLDNEKCYGDNFEYTVYEMAQYGTIPLLDWGAGNAIHLLCNGVNNATFLDYELGIFLKKDLSNIEECLTKMDLLMSNEELYDKLRETIYNFCKMHTNPQKIATDFIKNAYK